MPEELPVRRVEVSFVGAAPARQVERPSGVSDVEIDGRVLRCLVCGSFQPFLDALRGHEVVGLSSTPLPALAALRAALGDPGALSALPPHGSAIQAAQWATYRAESRFTSADGRTVLFEAALRAGDPGSNAALREVPAVRAWPSAHGRSAHAEPDVAASPTGVR